MYKFIKKLNLPNDIKKMILQYLNYGNNRWYRYWRNLTIKNITNSCYHTSIKDRIYTINASLFDGKHLYRQSEIMREIRDKFHNTSDCYGNTWILLDLFNLHDLYY